MQSTTFEFAEKLFYLVYCKRFVQYLSESDFYYSYYLPAINSKVHSTHIFIILSVSNCRLSVQMLLIAVRRLTAHYLLVVHQLLLQRLRLIFVSH